MSAMIVSLLYEKKSNGIDYGKEKELNFEEKYEDNIEEEKSFEGAQRPNEDTIMAFER